MPAHSAWRVFGASVQGALHRTSQIPNQDAWGHWIDAAGSSAAVAVADGHGAARHFRSEFGARAAVAAALAALQVASDRGGTPTGGTLQAISVDIERRWNEIVANHLCANPFTAGMIDSQGTAMPAVAYGSTLLAALVTPNYLALWQIGDGDIVCVGANGAATLPVPGDPTLAGNRTTSLCQPNAWQAFRVQLIIELPALVLLSTDGYANSFRSEADFLKIGPDYLQLLEEEPANLRAQLPDLLDESSAQGSGDDTTVAILERVPSVTKRQPRKAIRAPLWRRLFARDEMIRLFEDAPD